MKSFLSLVHGFDKVKQLSFCESQTLDHTDHLLVLVKILSGTGCDGVRNIVHARSEILLKHLKQRLFGQFLFLPPIALPVIFRNRLAHISKELGSFQRHVLFRFKTTLVSLH
jgi:hypothetical protein